MRLSHAAGILVLAVLMAGCGGADRSPTALVASALDRTAHADTYRASFAMKSDLEGTPYEMTGVMSSNAESTRMRGRFRMVEGSDPPAGGEMIVTGDEAFFRSRALDGVLPPGRRWMRMRDSALLTQPSLSPRQFVELLEDTPGTEEVGRERVRGVEAVRVRGPLDFDELVRRVGRGPLVEAWKSSAFAGRLEATVDLWIAAESHEILRVFLAMRCKGEPGALLISLDVLETGVSLADVRAPSDRLVADESELPTASQ